MKKSDSLVSFVSILLCLVLVLSWYGFFVFKYNKAKIQSFSSLKDGSCLCLVGKETVTLGHVSVLPEKISINYFSVSVSKLVFIVKTPTQPQLNLT